MVNTVALDADMRRRMEAGEIDAVHIGIVDTEGVFRDKRVSGKKALKLLDQGYSFCNVLYKWDAGEEPYVASSFRDSPAAIDPASFRGYPFEPNALVCLADFTDGYADLSPRELARRQVSRAERLGFKVSGAFEFEYFVFDETPASLRTKSFQAPDPAAPGNRTYSAQTAATHAQDWRALSETMAHLGVDLDAVHSELGPGCFEAPLSKRDGIAVADDAVLFKTFAKAYYLQRAQMACFMSKWRDDMPGQSGHLHLSLRTADGDQPLFHDGRAEDGLSQACRHFIAGLLELAPEFLALPAHTVNAYRRLVPGAWAPTHASWGVQNRTAALRAIPGTPDQTRVEFRVPGADTNPYLAFAMCLAAGLDGIERGLEAPPPSAGDCYAETPREAAQFPRTLSEAADRLDRSAAARRVFGAPFVDYFAGSRRREDAVARAHVPEWDVRRYLEVV